MGLMIVAFAQTLLTISLKISDRDGKQKVSISILNYLCIVGALLIAVVTHKLELVEQLAYKHEDKTTVNEDESQKDIFSSFTDDLETKEAS